MKSFVIFVTSLLGFSAIMNAQHQKEVVIMGTMHTVGKITGRAYKPMLKKAIRYAPQAIYVERQPYWDTVSVKNYFPKFYAKSDSLRKAMSFNEKEIKELMEKPTGSLSREEFKKLKLYYYARLDFANMEFYRRLEKYGINGPEKPERNENGDVTMPLALAMGIKEIRSMDNQTYSKEYVKTWRSCDEVGRKDGEFKYLKKALRKSGWRDISGVLTFQGLGRGSNKPKNALLSHQINSMEYRKTHNEVCDQANYYWDYRNEQMVKNVATQILESDDQRSIVVVGAGHVYGMMEAFARDYPEIKVIGFNDIPNNRGELP